MPSALRDVAVVAYTQSSPFLANARLNDAEMLIPLVGELYETSGLAKEEIGFTCSGSTDYIAGQSFAFVHAVDALGAWPPISESHVEMDGAWALYEAWVKIQTGEVDSALCFCFGRASMGTIEEVLTLQLDPYTVGPLAPDAHSLAALQARALIDSGKASERDIAAVVAKNLAAAKANPDALVTGDVDIDALLAEPCVASPLRAHALPPVTDGAARVREVGECTGVDPRHRAPLRADGPRAARPRDVGVDEGGSRRRRRARRAGRPRRAARALRTPGAHPARGARDR